MKLNLLKNKNFLIVLIGCICGLLLIFLGNTNSNKESDLPISENIYTSDEIESYTDSLEKKITSLLSHIGGVTEVNVMVTAEISKEKIYATSGNNDDYVIITDSSGNQSALTVAEINANIRGIAIVCNYGENEMLKKEIIDMLASLFNIGTNRISIINT